MEIGRRTGTGIHFTQQGLYTHRFSCENFKIFVIGLEAYIFYSYRGFAPVPTKGKRTKSKGLQKIQAKKNSTTHTEPYAVVRVVRLVAVAPERNRAAAAAEEPTAAAENAIATTAIRKITTACPLPDIS